MEKVFGTWNVRSLNRAGAVGLVSSVLDKFRIDLVVQGVRWEGTLESGIYTLFYGDGNAKFINAYYYSWNLLF